MEMVLTCKLLELSESQINLTVMPPLVSVSTTVLLMLTVLTLVNQDAKRIVDAVSNVLMITTVLSSEPLILMPESQPMLMEDF